MSTVKAIRDNVSKGSRRTDSIREMMRPQISGKIVAARMHGTERVMRHVSGEGADYCRALRVPRSRQHTARAIIKRGIYIKVRVSRESALWNAICMYQKKRGGKKSFPDWRNPHLSPGGENGLQPSTRTSYGKRFDARHHYRALSLFIITSRLRRVKWLRHSTAIRRRKLPLSSLFPIFCLKDSARLVIHARFARSEFSEDISTGRSNKLERLFSASHFK